MQHVHSDWQGGWVHQVDVSLHKVLRKQDALTAVSQGGASLYYTSLVDVRTVGVQALLTVAIYPLVTRIFSRAARAVRPV